MSQIKIVATIKVKEQYHQDVLKALHDVVDGTRTEAGNISYELHVDTKNPLSYVFIEVWESQDAISKHNESAHFNKFKSDIDGKIDGLDIALIKSVY